MKDTAAEIAKAEALLDWKPVTPPQEGFAETARWHLANASWLDLISL
jgi:nucleoside-diphosphate-sugar epimerase